MRKEKIRKMSVGALCGAVAFVLMFFRFSVPLLSPFAEFDASSLPELIGGFVLGPAGAVLIVSVKLFLKLLFQGTTTMLTGEVQNWLLSLGYVLPAVWYYNKHRTKRGAAWALAIGSVVSIALAVLTNLYLIFPAYIHLYGLNWDQILGMFSAVNPWIRSVPTMVAFSVIPFNVLLRGVMSVVTFLVYKKLSRPLRTMLGAG